MAPVAGDAQQTAMPAQHTDDAAERHAGVMQPRKGRIPQGRRAAEADEHPALPRSLFAEVFGTAALTTVAAGGEVIAAVSNGEVSQAARVVAPGLLVMALIYAIGDVSGAHINPAVTFAFAVRRDFPWAHVPLYWIAQLVGALLGAAFLRALFGTVAHLGATQVRHGVGTAFAMEIVLSWLLITVIIGTATRNRLIGPNAAIAVGATIALCGLFAGPISGASMNPARSLGPALIGGATEHVWVYIAGPFIGALLAVLSNWIMHGGRKPEEDEAATGKDGK